jgi:hypothetical protein
MVCLTLNGHSTATACPTAVAEFQGGTGFTTSPFMILAKRGHTVKFYIEIISTAPDGTEAISRRFSITAINPSGALRHARALLQDWRARHPSEGYARVLNAKGVELYQVAK